MRAGERHFPPDASDARTMITPRAANGMQGCGRPAAGRHAGTTLRGRRILLVADWYLKYIAGFSMALRQSGASVSLLCRDHAAEFGGRVGERQVLLQGLASSGIDVFEMPGRVRTPGTVPTALSLARAIRRWRPDIVHVQSEVHDPRLYALVAGYPVVLTLHDPYPHLGSPYSAGLPSRALRSLWRRRADRIVVHSDSLVRFVDKAHTAVVPHGASLAKEPLPPPVEPCVLFFGRLETYKGLDVLLEAMDQVWGVRPDIRLLIAGQGPLEHMIPKHPRIEVRRGYVPEGGVDELFARASIVALPYIDASQSGVGLLAVARGVPVVVSDVGGLPDLVPDARFVVPRRQPDSLAQAILAHVDHGASLRTQIHEYATRQFAWSVVAERALEIYDEVLDQRR
jgi:starch synthase